MAGSSFLVGLCEPHDGESFSANIPVLINCFRGVTCILPMAVALFKINSVIFKSGTNGLWTLHCLKHSEAVVMSYHCYGFHIEPKL